MITGKNLSAKIVETGFKLTGAEVMPHFVVADEKDAALAQELEEPAEEEVVFSEQSKKRCLILSTLSTPSLLVKETKWLTLRRLLLPRIQVRFTIPFLLWWCRVRENPFDACYWSSNVSESTRCQSQIC